MHISYVISHFGSDSFFRIVLAYLWKMRNCFQFSHVISIELLSKTATVTPVRCSSKSLKCFCREIELLLADVVVVTLRVMEWMLWWHFQPKWSWWKRFKQVSVKCICLLWREVSSRKQCLLECHRENLCSVGI